MSSFSSGQYKKNDKSQIESGIPAATQDHGHARSCCRSWGGPGTEWEGRLGIGFLESAVPQFSQNSIMFQTDLDFLNCLNQNSSLHNTFSNEPNRMRRSVGLIIGAMTIAHWVSWWSFRLDVCSATMYLALPCIKSTLVLLLIYSSMPLIHATWNSCILHTAPHCKLGLLAFHLPVKLSPETRAMVKNRVASPHCSSSSFVGYASKRARSVFFLPLLSLFAPPDDHLIQRVHW